MARPDDDHEPRAILGDDGEVLAIAHVSPDITPEGEAALRALVEAAGRMLDALPAEEREAMAERQASAIARVRDRARRLRTGYQCVVGGDACPGHSSKHLLCSPGTEAVGNARIRVRHDPGALMEEPDLYEQDDDRG